MLGLDWETILYQYQEGGISKEQRAIGGKGSPVGGNTESGSGYS
jgi:hypothetical protein